MSTDKFKNSENRVIVPAVDGFMVTKSDTADMPHQPRAITVNQGGIVKMTMRSGAVLTPTINAGVPFPCRPVRIWSTGTSAGITTIVGWL